MRELLLLGLHLAGLSVESIGRFLRFIRLFAISLRGPRFLFSLVAVLNAVPRRCKKDVYYSADNRKRLVTNGESFHSLLRDRIRVLANLAGRENDRS